MENLPQNNEQLKTRDPIEGKKDRPIRPETATQETITSQGPAAEKAEQYNDTVQKLESSRNQLRRDLLKENSIFKKFTEHVPQLFVDRLNTDLLERYLQEIEDDFQKRPQVAEEFLKIFVDGDREALREKSEQQRQTLAQLYYGKFSLLKIRERWQKKSKLDSFRSFTAGLRAVRGDNDKSIDVYRSPRSIGKVSSYGAADLFAQSDNYVYASFDGIRHFMTGHEELPALSERDCQDRGEIIMQDIANIVPRAPDGFATKYLQNAFDYETGKEILALYLASVFDTPQQATEFLNANNSPHMAQQWEMMFERYDAPIRDKMLAILAATGIEPPLSLEVRIKNSAAIERS